MAEPEPTGCLDAFLRAFMWMTLLVVTVVGFVSMFLM
jgi:hypothetical protein